MSQNQVIRRENTEQEGFYFRRYFTNFAPKTQMEGLAWMTQHQVQPDSPRFLKSKDTSGF